MNTIIYETSITITDAEYEMVQLVCGEVGEEGHKAARNFIMSQYNVPADQAESIVDVITGRTLPPLVYTGPMKTYTVEVMFTRLVMHTGRPAWICKTAEEAGLLIQPEQVKPGARVSCGPITEGAYQKLITYIQLLKRMGADVKVVTN